ncbi:DUF3775 domain-containing protein [Denitrobaculum tricleocarpae]|uniref:DUF3775 domain-containing protein n=1 Tax=Denitrobaculum tricleocarpae TaxID=2591009 RepID=A0A545TKE0_9PROT|nr:DUF3775 domain-containing protein [Denitrobaculum tricleocarpae]TQV77694.1 DUF3775 domain-containing protein [Denitrobaculum tricleocarpae]
MLEINPGTVCFLIQKAHQYDVKLAPEVSDSDGTPPPIDEDALDALEEHEDDPVADDPVYEEMKSFIDDMNDDAQVDLVALMWLGRDSAGPDDWQQIRSDAAEAHNDHSAEYLLGTPLLADYLSEGLAALGYSCEDYEN